MKKISTIGLVVILLFSCILPISHGSGDIVSPSSISPDQYEQAYRYNVQGWIYLHIEGDPYERGYQHGYLLAAEIVDMLNRWSNIIHNYPLFHIFSKRLSEERYQKVSAQWWGFCVSRCTNLYWEKIPEEFQQEIKGIADGVTARGGTIHDRNVTYQDILTMNEMYEFMSKLTRIPKKVNPLRAFWRDLKRTVPETKGISIDRFIDGFLNQEPAHKCNGFIATGNATTNGQIVIAQSTICGGGMWWWTYYISLRWNVLLDLSPSRGNRIIMPTSPGFIWSDEDYYQNDAGIVLLETTLPQGLFDNRGLPLSVRVRTAMQYGTSIDDVVYHLRYRNDGSMDAVWLVGDIKTGEIARFELGYRAFGIWRTFNGFHWSANNPYTIELRIEKFDLYKFITRFFFQFVKIPGFGFHSIRYKPESRDIKYKELGEKYYGRIDVDVVKKISFTPPISDWITDCKISDSDLVMQNGLWAFFGNPWKTLNITSFDTKNETIQSVPSCGWVRLFGVPEKPGFILQRDKQNLSGAADIKWIYNTSYNRNDFSSFGAMNSEVLYQTTSSGMLYALNAKNGDIYWKKAIGENITSPVVKGSTIYVGHSQGVTAYTIHGELQWNFPSQRVVSPPVINDDSVFFGDSTGQIYSVSAAKGTVQWNLTFNEEIYPTLSSNNILYLSSGNSCYAFNKSTHQILWKYDTQGKITTPPACAGNSVYVASWDTHVYALDALTGTLQWIYETGFGFDTAPIVSHDLVFVAGIDNNLYALQIKDGSLAWMFSCNAAIHSTPVVYGMNVFFGSDDGRFYAINWSTGNIAWSFTPDLHIEAGGLYNFLTTPLRSYPVAGNETVFLGAKGIIYALHAQTSEPPENDNGSSDDNSSDDDEDNESDDDQQNNTGNNTQDQLDEEENTTGSLLVFIGAGGGIFILLLAIFFFVRMRRQTA